MRLSDFDYALPAELIAQTPAPRREDSRLLVVPPAGPPAHRRFAELVDLLPAGALLIVNDARVIPARLRARRPTGGAVEILLVARTSVPSPETWTCLVRGKFRPGTRLVLVAPPASLPAAPAPVVTFLGRHEDGSALVSFADADPAWLEAWGETPLPPYIARPAAGPSALDRERYQTVFAREPGAVAAPTAGLHFTDDLLAALATRGIARHAVTLLVGPGTFAPVRDEDLDRHVMHVERYDVPAVTAAAHAAARAAGRPIVAVGTTVVRTLESAADADGIVRHGPGETRLFIRPPYRVRTLDLLLTNFHMPRSTLLMLVSAFGGHERIRAAYADAVAHRYRFFSYGDAMLLHPAGGS